MRKASPLVQKELTRIPGIGKSLANDLILLGYQSVNQLKGENPQSMYERLCDIQKQPVDRCVLYVFRCAVYFANHENHDPELLKWWNWKNKEDVTS